MSKNKKTVKTAENSFGKVSQKLAISESVEIHIKTGAKIKGVEYVDVRKYIKTKKYEGYTGSGLMIPKTQWSKFVALVGKVKA